ncbi:4-(cytidine 5'-diphospho)-2-C-methyl-D-erythritol kinase [Candidatus Desulfovibrio trichonymphae]|uniref:4-diphosphocytidyl-2-C-methyl-D-erythritol kinase n=1 Tax=Candidatus Desulfovibrio trichonymphae TaxID=1725232 RepID=A0A1J1DVC8_9BACT|nr:4-(cytidine 5'-diphospho)-2-C-methyl-D-erythritol kinase [Candidatus Desulfovibrio trichonymphae]BAV91820.1 4-diphosphocytidyl-2-C-methyl-D-erythritol kinase [Candidatus Desulfovibrio trichonymphae]GHU91964.1 4-diphosphocytidyl-2-C-methyl-D-erythritol kinase [Deltaproteobacteria bacterium]GHU93702.1 4-diphosphocytidyl-2-C-methyl-D-erythritol kinase [Deltaproteobacteria bacterium]GHU97846.1 4-diphosphocytidyl-2-C-methyl-D-erythritol kinase [Deltaproteobacteria bacterium]
MRRKNTPNSIRITCGCKVNLGLRVTGVRADGYHELDSIFYSLPYPCDDLIIRHTRHTGVIVRCNTPSIDPNDNTLTKAWAAFAQASGDLPGIEIELRKRIPQGAGLGGGSSDAAALLRWLNSTCAFPFDKKTLRNMALSVGADTPFFLQNTMCRVHGIGEKLSPLNDTFSGFYLVLVCPDIHISTLWAYARYDALARTANYLVQQKNLTNRQAKDNKKFSFKKTSIEAFCNDLEAAVFPGYPQLAAIKADLLLLGADAACMSGSGSSLVGLFSRAGAAIAKNAAEALRTRQQRVFLLPL